MLKCQLVKYSENMKQKPNWPKIKKTLEKNGFPKSIIERQEKSWDRFKTALEEVEMPEGAEVLTVQIQYNEPTMWFKCETKNKMEKRNFIIAGTGFELPSTPMGKYAPADKVVTVIPGILANLLTTGPARSPIFKTRISAAIIEEIAIGILSVVE